MQSATLQRSEIFKEYIFVRTGNILLGLLFFLVSANKLFSFPIDKIALPVYIASAVLLAGGSFSLLKKELYSLLVFLFCCLLSIATNVTSFSPIILFPVLGLLFSFIVSKKVNTLFVLYYSLIFHISLGIFLWIASYAVGINVYVSSMGAKGLPFLHEAKGLTATVQTFGTLCITWFLLYEIKKEQFKRGLADKFLYVIASFAILITFNRATYLAYFVMLFFTNRKLLFLYCFILLLFIVYFIDSISLLFLNMSSLDARSDLLEGFRKSYFESGSLLTWLFGRGNNSISNNILQEVTIFYRSDIENGHAMLLHTYGLTGYLIYLCGSLYFIISSFLQHRNFFYCCMCLLYFILLPYITQEYMSTTFYIFLSVIFYKARQKLKYKKPELIVS